ncbi:MAG: GNAT family N-acetyltransferase [Rhodothermia bacterium]|nr:GNAT family N-acetyltransferase [Rhodothermia bacterium]
MKISIENVRPDRFEIWRRLRSLVYEDLDAEFDQLEMKTYYEADDKECFLAIVDEVEVCGMIEVSLRNVVDGCSTSPVGYIEGIVVLPARRGRGIARALLAKGEEWCRSKGCAEVATDAELDNVSAQRFHESMGFQETYRVVEYRKDL